MSPPFTVANFILKTWVEDGLLICISCCCLSSSLDGNVITLVHGFVSQEYPSDFVAMFLQEYTSFYCQIIQNTEVHLGEYPLSRFTGWKILYLGNENEDVLWYRGASLWQSGLYSRVAIDERRTTFSLNLQRVSIFQCYALIMMLRRRWKKTSIICCA